MTSLLRARCALLSIVLLTITPIAAFGQELRQILPGILGNTVNYWIGNYIGPRAFSGNIRFLKKEYLDRTHAFYEKHGGKTIILARFIPIIRTFAPFVAGIGAMTYSHFLTYNVVGGIIWVASFTLAGYFFGNLPVVQHNFSLVIVAIIIISLAPMVFEFLKNRLAKPPVQNLPESE